MFKWFLKKKEEPQEKAEEESGLFQRLKDQIARTRESFVKQVDRLFLGKKEIDADLLDSLEEILITADLGVSTATELIERIREKVKRKELSDAFALKNYLREEILTLLRSPQKEGEEITASPFVILVIGVNGTGKTTTIGKLAHRFKGLGQNVMLVAADTFRAAAIEQLEIWSNRAGADFIKQKSGSDPSAVVYDALEAAQSRKTDVMIIDTAGRLHTKVNLMEELKKLQRVIQKKMPGAPHEILLVLDATTGQNAISQAKLFNSAVGITGMVLTKLDGTAKGGVVVGISNELKIPIRFIGIGEKIEDLREFDPDTFVSALFD
ncbi:MAG: signal recognition particle-docking protein FtsY [Deltaproteobacteria bacterium]|nr:MAG: signal recognition particle-docking protein FtsY [Deltaproteobacteria bacterium]